MTFASLEHNQARFYWNLIIRSFDKGKPVERRGRKAMGLKPRMSWSGLPCYRKRIRNSPVLLERLVDVEKTMTLNLKALRTFLNAALLLALFGGVFFHPTPVPALGNGESAPPNFAEFSKTVQNNEANTLRGVYVPDVLAFPIVQQPSGNAGYVSPKEGEITQFGMVSQFGNVGLLAHNHLSGRFFSQLAVGQEVRLVFGDGKVEYFVITQILQFQALQPTSPYSSFRDLANDDILTAEQLFNKVYRGERHITFQTCIAAKESPSWGRLFVIATPSTKHVSTNVFDTKLAR
jgi:hypothetical protein